MQARFTRLYADAQGVSHFAAVELDLPPGFAVPPAEPLNVATIGPASLVSIVGGTPAWKGTTPHPIPHRLLYVLLRGEVEITASDGEARIFRAGDVLMAEDTTGQGHASRIIGDADCQAIVVILAEQG